MQVSNLMKIIVSAIIGVVVFAAILVPVTQEAVTTEKTFTNEGYFTYDAVTDDTSITITWDADNAGVVTIGDVDVTMPTNTGSYTIAGSENFCLRYFKDSTRDGFQCYGDGGYLSAVTNNADAGSAVITSSSLVLTKTLNGTDTSKTYTMGTHGFVLNPDGDGDLTLKYSDSPAYINSDTEVYLCGTTFITGSGTNDFVGIFGYGKYDDLTMSTFYGTDTYDVTFGEITADIEEVDGYNDLYLLEKFVFNVTQNSATIEATYSYFVVPTEVTAKLTYHPDASQIALINIIPLLVLVGLVLGVVGAVLARRD